MSGKTLEWIAREEQSGKICCLHCRHWNTENGLVGECYALGRKTTLGFYCANAERRED